MENEFSHVSVMLRECIEALNIKKDGIYVDCTTGGGGHSLEIAKRLDGGRLICIDRDGDALEAAKARLAGHLDKITFVRDNFSNIENILDSLGVDKIDGALADLGVSSYQFDTAERGFSYKLDAPLDMRMDVSSPKSAYDVVNTYSEEDLKRIISEYGEENFASKIARQIVRAREISPIKTTTELSDIVCACYPAKLRAVGHHPAKKTFQAIRIEVNGELDVIAPTVKAIVSRLGEGGRLAVITFHSLEDRAVKTAFAELAQGCVCPPSFPVCVCGRKPKIKIITKKPILPSEDEINTNRRSHSAKLRVAEKAEQT
ncbi:MAG: 16S rRNA (cytosine(1402)-N(4))-methyltransferase RsmH [Clostridia bacterium]|nr:16S rRNA (cytosine(1402)-N(4))-methyltransferase RsmH [Clostridia bacterium]MBO4428415.1 16S rRNA (cytosine(1402)-N(4))-methyltransferase RsmH [Clostridia bacterium]